MKPNPAFQATIETIDDKTVSVYIKLSGTNPFKKGAKTFIAKAQFPLAFLKGQDVPKPSIISDLGFNAVVDELVHAANKKEDYYSINLVPGADVEEMIIGKEKLLFTATFENGIPKGLKILNCVSAFNNQQCQFTIQDNHGREYTAPFDNPSALFYSTPGKSRIGHAGTGAGGINGLLQEDMHTPVTSTYESWVKVV